MTQTEEPSETGGTDGPGPGSRFFLWCAGSDGELLETPAERTKHVGLGTLVVVPAVLAAFAMSYAISTLTEGWSVPVLAGLAWAFIVFCFDRFIVSTFRKSPSVLTDLVSPVFLVRLVLAGFVGLIVAHPLVLLYFHDSVEEQLRIERGASLQGIEEAYGSRFETLFRRQASLREEIKAKEQVRLEAQSLLMQEIGGIPSSGTTGRVGRGPAARAQEELRDMARRDLAALKADLAVQEEALRREREDLLARRQGEREAPQALDYIARSRALETLRRGSPEVARIHLFLILFFVFVDTLPVLFKGLTPRGPYDEKLALQELRASSAAQRERWGLRTVYQEMARAQGSRAGRRAAQRRGLPALYGELVADLERHQGCLRDSLRREAASTAEGLSEGQREAQELALERIDGTNLRVVSRAVQQFEESFLEPPAEGNPQDAKLEGAAEGTAG